MKSVITVSRQLGAGGREVGKLVAEKLGYSFYDKAIITEAAKSSGVDMELLAKYDEKVPADFGFAQSLLNIYNQPLNEKIYAAQRDAVRKLAEKGKCVIVGRNANAILKEFDRSLHIFICAPIEVRKENLSARFPEETEAHISEMIHSHDRMRSRYCAHFTNTVFGEPSSYDVCLNTGRLSANECVNIICKMAMEE